MSFVERQDVLTAKELKERSIRMNRQIEKWLKIKDTKKFDQEALRILKEVEKWKE